MGMVGREGRSSRDMGMAGREGRSSRHARRGHVSMYGMEDESMSSMSSKAAMYRQQHEHQASSEYVGPQADYMIHTI